MDFGAALKAMKKGKKATRKNWQHAHIMIAQKKTETDPPPRIVTEETGVVWFANQGDLLAEDWEIVT